jgi:hypothetical protein
VAGEEHPAGAAESSEQLKLAPNVACQANVALVAVVWDEGCDVNVIVMGRGPDHFAGDAASWMRARRNVLARTCLAGW